jgi:hypothetical protein
MTAIHSPSYGMIVDLINLIVQRSLAIPTTQSQLLLSQVRCALLDGSNRRVVVLAHNRGALAVSHAVSQLCADLPESKLCKLEVYTFGSAAPEFVVPVGDTAETLEKEVIRGPHIEHFAFFDDPFARLGVLRGTQQELDSRCCGGVFIIDGRARSLVNNVRKGVTRSRVSRNGAYSPPSNYSPAWKSLPSLSLSPRPQLAGLLMDEYMSALFPPRVPGIPSDGALESPMSIDRSLAENRELAALSIYKATQAAGGERTVDVAKAIKSSKRNSWTVLGATVGPGQHVNGARDGILSVNMARAGCLKCEGHTGREVSWLSKYIGAGQFVEPVLSSETHVQHMINGTGLGLHIGANGLP